MEPIEEVARYLQGSLLERLRKIAAEEAKVATSVNIGASYSPETIDTQRALQAPELTGDYTGAAAAPLGAPLPPPAVAAPLALQPSPMTHVASLSPAEKAARLERGTTAVHVLADMLYGPREGQQQKLAAVIATETFKVAAMDLVDWAPRSNAVIQSVLAQAGVKTAADNDRFTADYVGRLLAHGLYARHLEAIGACR